MSITVATWNVNSIRARMDRVLDWLRREKPDIVCLQELKVTTELFPLEPLEQMGYHCAVLGQKTYNGVAILSLQPPEDIRRGMIDDAEQEQARLISARIGGLDILSAYFPNGSTVGSEKWEFKLRWIKRLRAELGARFDPSSTVLLCGDFNIATDDGDVAKPDRWADTVLYHPIAREALADLKSWGFEDIFRQKNPDGGIYSWWDYRAGAFHRNDGLRIDYLYATPSLATCCEQAWVDRDERKGTRPSDHAPVLARFSL
ncbi:MAG: exodeoxyribonuclease III [Phycisphaerae bacterium]